MNIFLPGGRLYFIGVTSNNNSPSQYNKILQVYHNTYDLTNTTSGDSIFKWLDTAYYYPATEYKQSKATTG